MISRCATSYLDVRSGEGNGLGLDLDTLGNGTYGLASGILGAADKIVGAALVVAGAVVVLGDVR